jgi:hypothetical protein
MNTAAKKELTSAMKGLIGLIVVIIALSSSILFWRMYYIPRYANVERQAFEQTRSYVHGKIQDLTRYYRQHNEADADGKRAIKEFF